MTQPTPLPPIANTMLAIDRLNQQMQRTQSVVRDMLGKQPQIPMDPALVDQVYAAMDLDFLTEPLGFRHDEPSGSRAPVGSRAARIARKMSPG